MRRIFIVLAMLALSISSEAITMKQPPFCDDHGNLKGEAILENVITGAALGLVTTFAISVFKPSVVAGSFAGVSVIAGIAGLSVARVSDCSRWFENAHPELKKD